MPVQCRGMIAAVLLALQFAGSAAAEQDSWQEVVERARGQTVFFNGWGGSDRINAYVAWAAERVESLYGVELRHVRVGDIAEVVARLLAEKTAGRTDGGSVDLMWINGENFAAMKEHGLLGEPFVDRLPNFELVDTAGRPTVLVDFTVPTDGLEAPWGLAQLVFIYDTATLAEPPRSLPALLDWATENPGRFAYPMPPDFHGTTFLKQALVTLAEEPSQLSSPVEPGDMETVAAPLWSFLEDLHPHLWRGGRAFPTSGPALLRLLDDGEVDIAFNFNPSEASAAIRAGQLPDSVRTYVLDEGTLGNAHFVAIPFNTSAREGAMVVANFLLSPEAQARKLDPRVWGDPTVLDTGRLGPADRTMFAAAEQGAATLSAEELGTPLPEPHPSWTTAIEAEWQRRFGG